jgi:PAS domain S-box-containing protein
MTFNEQITNLAALSLADCTLMRQVVEGARNGVLLTGSDGTILVINRAARRIVGGNEKLLGGHLGRVLPQVWHDLQTIIATGKAQIAAQVNIGGQLIIANRTPVRRGQRLVGVLSIFQHLSEYESVLTELKAYKDLNEELNVIINSSYDGLWICDHEGKVVRVNRASEKMSGVKEHQVIGRPMQDLVADGTFDRSATLEVLKNQTAVTLIQTLSDGRHILVTGNPVRDETGQIRLVVVNARDISELNRLHAELEESRALTHKFRSELAQIRRIDDLNSRIIIRSKAMQHAFETAMRAAAVDSNILISGESGVGKGLLAELIHEASSRRQGPLIRINCGAIPETLIEAELFGYEKGAFTGAQSGGKPGYFEIAEGGTLFLDEVGEVPRHIQVKLLRFLESNEVTRIGSTTSRKIDVRIISATNRNLERLVAEGAFRKDLFFRLNVVPVVIPTLRQRSEDIPPLIHLFLRQFNEKYHMQKSITAAAVDCLCRYGFPGNIRELQNLVERCVVLCPADRIDAEQLPANVRRDPLQSQCSVASDEWDLKQALAQIEQDLIGRALKRCGSQREAARLLGVDHSTLCRKIKRLNLGSGANLQYGENIQL